MITAISLAAKYSPMATDAMSAMLTRTFAFKSKDVISPFAASRRMSVPLIMMLIQGGSKGSIPFSNPDQLIKRKIAEMMVKIIVLFSLLTINS